MYVSVNLASQQFFVCSQSSPEKRNLQDLYREREKEIYLSELAHVDCGCLANGVSQQAAVLAQRQSAGFLFKGR